MNNPDYISESLETIFWDKILKFFDADTGCKNSDPGSGMEKIRIRDKHRRYATLLACVLNYGSSVFFRISCTKTCSV
jgi:hypothetical protein